MLLPPPHPPCWDQVYTHAGSTVTEELLCASSEVNIQTTHKTLQLPSRCSQPQPQTLSLYNQPQPQMFSCCILCVNWSLWRGWRRYKVVRVLAVAHPACAWLHDFQLAILCFTVTRCALYSKTSCDCFSSYCCIQPAPSWEDGSALLCFVLVTTCRILYFVSGFEKRGNFVHFPKFQL